MINSALRLYLPYSFATLAFLLAMFGVVMIYNASPYVNRAVTQFVWLMVGSFGFLIGATTPYVYWKRLAWPLYFVAVALLILVLLPGLGDNSYGAQRWIRLEGLPVLGAVGFQPSEIAKFSLIVFFSAWFAKKGRRKDSRTLTGFLSFLGLVVFLIMLQPDLGTTLIILCSIGVIYLLAREPMKYFLLLCVCFVIGVIILIIIAPYRMNRLMSFFHFVADPVQTHDALGSTYHIRQAVIGISAGGVLGVGPGESRQKYGYLPFPETDSIFAIIAEEFGLIGTSFFLFIVLLFLRQGLMIADSAKEDFGRLLAAGIIVWFSSQILLNVGAMVAAIPFTGVPLLFISYGGSALVVGMFAVGILVNIGLSAYNTNHINVKNRVI